MRDEEIEKKPSKSRQEFFALWTDIPTDLKTYGSKDLPCNQKRLIPAKPLWCLKYSF